MIKRIVLMVGFRIVEGLERNNLGHNRFGKDLGRVQLGDVSLAEKELNWKAENDLTSMLSSAWAWENYINNNPF